VSRMDLFWVYYPDQRAPASLHFLNPPTEISMTSPKVPPGAERVALGHRSKESKEQRKKTGFADHKPGIHAEADYAQIGKVASRKQSIKPPAKNPQGGRDANVR
jgi:hypothetical protein